MAPIRLLIVEDSDDDALLMVHRFRRAGMDIEHRRAETAREMEEALRVDPPDAIISDFNVPGFGAEAALALLREHNLDLPFIVVSGEVGEERAAALMKAGAHDVVLKERLARLAPALARELREAADRRQRQAAELALRRSEERFRLIAEHAKDIIFRFRLRPDMAFEYVSPAVEAIIGHTPEELYADPMVLAAILDPDDKRRVLESWEHPRPEPLVMRWRRLDGRVAWTEQRAVSITDDQGRAVAVEGILRDVTSAVLADQERERLEQQLRQAERLESLGQLAGGIAHDFNNLLAVITGYAAMVDDAIPPNDPAHADLEGIRAAAQRGAGLTRQLLIFSKREPSRPERVDLNLVVEETQILLSRTLGEDIALCSRLTPGLLPVVADRSKVEQVLMNLVMNSRAAMPDGGELTIATSNLPGSGDVPGQVELTVVDTGCGMPEEVASRAFEPFFTTRGPTNGSGLGLATAYGAVKEAGGDISIASAVGVGTTVRITLPVAPAGPPQHVAPAAPQPERPAGDAGGTVLLVEDEDAVREIVRRILIRAGYAVLHSGRPKEALRMFAEHGQDIDAVIADVVMPEMSGTQMVAQMLHERPDLPVLFMSGYTMGEAPGGYALPEGAPLLRKPFDGKTLVRRLRELVDAPRAV
ncbi:hybrid sensor histidine kinase/response regulator [Pilimelia columellifera]|uniref:histidine kinase n=1 Tax=Pilimelia columellifera subsp. columellifera TaxID=706583 RepID=A0ABN3N8I2_9ACTN